MSVFDANFTELGEPQLLSLNGRSVSYTPIGGSAVPLTAIVGAVEERDDPDDPHGRSSRRVRTISMSRDASGPFGGIADPGLNDTVVIDSETWAVETEISRTQSMVQLEVVRTMSYLKTRDGYYKGGR